MKIGGLFAPLFSRNNAYIKLDLFRMVGYLRKQGGLRVKVWKMQELLKYQGDPCVHVILWSFVTKNLQANDRKIPLPTSREIRYLQARHVILWIVVLVPKSGDFIPAANPHVISQTLGIVKKVFEPLGSSRPSH